MSNKFLKYFSKKELLLWLSSISLIIVCFIVFDRANYLTMINSLIGATSLIFIAKGNPVGQGLTVIFSLMYGYISYSCAYYGEMITYLGMTAPMAVISLVSWMKNPYQNNRSEVKINKLKYWEIIFAFALTAAVTIIFYFILKALNTASLIISIFSVFTSFLAVYLTFRRSSYYALAYAANDIVLIIMWSLMASENISYISVIICFIIFLANDLYGFYNWNRMSRRQSE
ncbi:MAG: nicotinamide riboside transporter PnuC [Clostridium sp.]|nr:nicotinamide riboside transporter PnuC [Clostridium sp.]MCM1547531.1 nicotinamide riboside transporter PnuC [Ruminococcus sp.]